MQYNQCISMNQIEKKMCTMFRRKFNRDFLKNFFMVTTEGCKQGTFSIYDDETKLVVIG